LAIIGSIVGADPPGVAVPPASFTTSPGVMLLGGGASSADLLGQPDNRAETPTRTAEAARPTKRRLHMGRFDIRLSDIRAFLITDYLLP
jgi:hypothetical protein